ncbi:MAG: DNA alkylation repair protein [Saprospiraceae bacterium]|nr:DNA alkylation repair protein [Saprospiraceae bacterium]
MNQINETVKFVITELEKAADPRRLEMAITNYPTSQRLIGVIVPELKIILKSLKTGFRNEPYSKHIEFAKALVNTNILECQHIAYEFLGKNMKAFKTLREKDVLDLCKNLDNWVSVDTFSCFVGGLAWKEGIIDDELIINWTKSENRWIRRVALVCTVPLNTKSNGGIGNTQKTLMICEMLKHDKDDMVIKALSWALRKLISFDKKSVEEFLIQNENILHNRVKREVRHKLETGLKN